MWTKERNSTRPNTATDRSTISNGKLPSWDFKLSTPLQLKNVGRSFWGANGALWFQRYGFGLQCRRQRMPGGPRPPLRLEHLRAVRRRALGLFLKIIRQLFQLRFLFRR